MTSVDWTLILIFCVDVHIGLDPLPSSTCVHLSLTPSPLRVDVINGWPFRDKIQRCNTMEPYVCMYVGMHVWMYAASIYACIVFVSSLSMSISEAHVCMTFFICMFACMYV